MERDRPDIEPILESLAPLVKAAFQGPPEMREASHRNCVAMMKAIARLFLNLGATPEHHGRIIVMLRGNMLEGMKRFATMAGLDEYDSEAYILSVQRAFEEVIAETGAALPDGPTLS